MPTKIAVTFSGQGAQYTGMGKELHERYPIVRQTFEEASDALGRDVFALCGLPQDELNQTVNTQPAIAALEVAVYRLLAEQGVRPAAMAGFSIGEWPALICSGALDFAAGMRLIAARAKFMQEAVPPGESGMLAVLGLKREKVLSLCEAVGEGIWPANFNCPRQTVLAGTKAAVWKAMAIAAEEEIMAKPLAVSIPSHCPLMEPAAKALAPLVAETAFHAPVCPVVCNADGQATTDPEMLRVNIVRQLTQPVYYEECLRTLEGLGIDTIIEVGPGKVLAGLAKKTVPAIARLRVEDESTLRETLKAMEG